VEITARNSRKFKPAFDFGITTCHSWARTDARRVAVGSRPTEKTDRTNGPRAFSVKVVELRVAGQTLDAIRQHLNYRMRVRTRTGGEWATNRIGFLIQQGLRLLAETDGGDPDDSLPPAHADEE
jgi:hypothetical protein